MFTKDGICYRVRHERPSTLSFPGRLVHQQGWGPGRGPFVFPKGGRTVVEILTKDTDVDDVPLVLAVGVAVCRPDETYNRRLGRTIALGRALKRFRREPCDFVQIDEHEWRCNSHDVVEIGPEPVLCSRFAW